MLLTPPPHTFAEEEESISQRFQKGREIHAVPVLEQLILGCRPPPPQGDVRSTDWQGPWKSYSLPTPIIHVDTPKQSTISIPVYSTGFLVSLYPDQKDHFKFSLNVFEVRYFLIRRSL